MRLGRIFRFLASYAIRSMATCSIVAALESREDTTKSIPNTTLSETELGPNGTAITITTAPNMVPAINVAGLQSDGKVSEPAGMRCQLRNNGYRSISRVSQNYMLPPPAAIIG